MSNYKPVVISSLIGSPVRRIKFPGFDNTFIIAQNKWSEFRQSRYTIIDEQSMTIITDAPSLSGAIENLNRFLEHKKQSDLNLIIEKIQLNIY